VEQLLATSRACALQRPELGHWSIAVRFVNLLGDLEAKSATAATDAAAAQRQADVAQATVESLRANADDMPQGPGKETASMELCLEEVSPCPRCRGRWEPNS
jgi:hypothetical protein